MSIQSILNRKKECILKVRYEASVKEASDLLRQRNSAALLVTRGEAIVGVISERDIVIALSRFGEPALYMPIGAVVSRDMVVAISPEDDLKAAMSTMMRYRVRHLLVIKDRALVGLVSLDDLVGRYLDDLRFEPSVLQQADLALQ